MWCWCCKSKSQILSSPVQSKPSDNPNRCPPGLLEHTHLTEWIILKGNVHVELTRSGSKGRSSHCFAPGIFISFCCCSFYYMGQREVTVSKYLLWGTVGYRVEEPRPGARLPDTKSCLGLNSVLQPPFLWIRNNHSPPLWGCHEALMS